MKSFLDNNTDGGKTFLLYGKLNDCFCPASLMTCDIDSLLVQLLKSRGYEHIVFYGGAGNRGKHCYDPESAKFFIEQPTESASTAPPAPTGQEAPAATTPAGASPSEQMEGMLRPARRRRSDNRRRAEAAESATPAPAPASAPTSADGAQIRYSQISISNAEFVQEITYRASTGEKFAVVFYNIFDFIRGSGDNSDRKLLDQIVSILDKPSCQVLCIFQAPSDPDVKQLCRDLSASPLGIKFLRTEGEDLVLNRYNCFHIGVPGEDEVQNLLRRLRMNFGRKKLNFDSSQIRPLAHDLLKQVNANSSEESTTLMRIQICLEEWIQNNPGKMLDKAAIARLFDQDVEDDTPTLERLGKVRGWEKVYDLINGVLVLLRRQIKQSAVNEAALPPEAPDICVERLAGIRTLRQKRQVPVPNFVLTGNPGTGKTEIGNMIGDILYEEGILPTSKVIMVGKSELTSSLVAGIPAAVIRCADRAEGGVLFIDEAPQIADEDGGVNNEGSGPEVIQTLNRVMTDPTRRLCVVLAGYQQGMEKLFGIDPGFRSRFGGNEVNIDDYEPDLLCSIFRKRLENMNGLSFTPAPSLYDPSRTDGEKQPLDHYMEHLYLKRDRRTFGNARSMVTLARNVAGRALSENRQEIRQEDFYGIAPFSETSTESEPDVVDDTWFAPVNPTDSMDELERYIRENTVGLEFLIERFRLIYERVMECRAQGLPEDKMQLRSFVLIGNPGSGKDLVANLLGRLFRILNVLNCPEIITHDGGDLASSYLGGSIERAKEWIEEAQSRNALLFINEAHQLTNERFDGKGALRAFIAPMTNNKQFVSAFAVYPGECEAFYKLDDGLRSRLEEIRLPDYTDKQLYEIFLRMCKKKGVLVDHPDMSATLALVSRICVRLYRDFQPNNGNARQMQVLLQEMDDLRVARCRRCNIPFDSENRRVFLPEDIPPVWLRKLPDRGCNDPDDRDDFGEIERILRQEVVGRENLVDEFRKLSDEAMEARVQKRDNFWPKPIILEGYPGSGKTLIGRLLARLYNILGVVRCDEPITFDASALSSCYQNGVRRAAEDIIEEARRRGAVVFVDEAHQLLDQTDGRGALQAFISPMNDPDISRRVLVVFAVYHDRLEEFKASDQGLQRRVNILSLTDYTGPELKQILLHMARNNGNTITPELETQLDAICDRLYENRTASSGNAGLMENFLHDMNDLRRQRCRLRAIPYDAPNYMELCPEDVPPSYLA